jgi:hypothetical protein
MLGFMNWTGAALFVLALAGIAVSPARAEAPVYTGSQSVFVSYADGSGDGERAPTINLGFAGHRDGAIAARFQMDTGSVGIIASEDHFRPGRNARNLGPGQQTYTSSGIVENGTWWLDTVNIYDADGNRVAEAEVPVLLVESVTCLPEARDCRPRERPRGVAMMGVGFAREGDRQPHGTPDYNPFLNLRRVAGPDGMQRRPEDWRNGYVVTARGVYLGLTAADTANAAFAKLAPNPAYSTPELPEWMPTPMTLTVNGVSADGRLLMDTGVKVSYLSPPAGARVEPLGPCRAARSDRCAPPQTTVTVSIPSQANPVASYSYTVGQDGNPMQPDDVVIVRDATGAFLNTSRHFLAGMNFIYDETGGYVGFQWTGGASGSGGFVRP